MYFCSLREFVKWLMETKQELLTLMSFLLGVGLGEGPGHFSEPQALQSLPYILGWETLSSAHKRGRVPLAWCGFSFHPFQVLKEAPGQTVVGSGWGPPNTSPTAAAEFQANGCFVFFEFKGRWDRPL